MTEPQHHAVWIAVWEFQVRPESIAEFERAYGPDGPWAQLFRRSSAYLGTELLRDTDRAGRYLTIDRWASRDAFQQFKQQYAGEYAALDRALEKLTEGEALVGDFEAIVP
jgi:heme-degrading monooxygenase HmoA